MVEARRPDPTAAEPWADPSAPQAHGMLMRTSVDPQVIQAAARLLDQDPGISNPRILQRLARVFGSEITRAIPVTRVERLVREPALLLLRNGSANGPRAPGHGRAGQGRADQGKAGQGGGTPERPEASPESKARRDGRRAARDRHRREAVDAALLEAFTLGASTESAAEVVEAFRKLDALRRRVREAPTGSS